ncbi:MAG: nicotinate-nucleotide--dimethylbenzimidazole phosphoribosyltransferase [Clostridium fessum]
MRAAAALGEEVPDFSKRALLIFCADNGVVEEGVSQTGQEVTAAVVSNMTRGRSCSCLMAEKGRDRCVSDRYGNCL